MKTIGFDTNVLITLKLQRQPNYRIAKSTLQNCVEGKIKIFIPIPAFLETEWVLRSYYKEPKEKIVEYFEELLVLDNIIVENKDELQLALNVFKQNTSVGFTDCIILVQIQINNYNFLTFDKKLEKLYQSLL